MPSGGGCRLTGAAPGKQQQQQQTYFYSIQVPGQEDLQPVSTKELSDKCIFLPTPLGRRAKGCLQMREEA
jgi:hypothetical protein